MQHSGAPTRLLDWTESALIALFFAVKGPRNDTDAAVWILEPWKLNEYGIDIKEVIAPGASEGMAPTHAVPYSTWLPDRYLDPEGLRKPYPVAVYPTHFSRRISSQRSCFTIHGSEVDGFNFLPEGFSKYLRMVKIPADKAHAIEVSLSVAGVDEVTIFPDFDGLGRWLTAILRDERFESPEL